VREALVRLEKEGLVEVVPRRGMRVRSLSPADMRELYDILCCLEAKAVELLARHPERDLAVAQLERQVALMERALAEDDLDAWAAADARFHDLLLELSGNRRLAALGRAHLEQAQRVRAFTLRLRRKPMRSTEDHRQLLSLIADGDADAARELNWRHREAAAEELLDILDRFQLRHL
jgi:DNA-binding GntR family transcriptional regulator